MSRPIATAATYLWLLLVLTAGVILLVPILTEQITQFINQFPTSVAVAELQLRALDATLKSRGVEADLARYLDYPDLIRRAETLGLQVLSNALSLATGIATLLFQVTLILILSFYITLDGERISANLHAAVPVRIRSDLEFLFASVNQAFAGFLRSQVLQGLMTIATTAAIMLALGMDYVLLISLVSGGLMIIPFIGPPLALIPPLALGYFTKPESLWLLLVALVVQQQLVVNIIAPRLVGAMIGMHPLLVFFAVLAGMKLAGGWGVVFGIPIMAVLVAMFTFYRAGFIEHGRRLSRAVAENGHATPEHQAATPREERTAVG
jgi:predicted PurR-regulated permease PerM